MIEEDFDLDFDSHSFIEIFDNIASESNADKKLARIIKLICKVSGMDYCFLSIIDDLFNSTKIVRYSNLKNLVENNEFPDVLSLKLFPWLHEKLRNKSVVYINLDKKQSEYADSIIDLLKLKNIKYFIAIPINSNENLLGFIGLISDTKDSFFSNKILLKIKLLCLIVSEILENSKMTRELEIVEKKSESLVENSNDIIITIKSNYDIENVNKKPLLEYLGYNPEDVIGFSLLSFVHHDDFDKLEKVFDPKSPKEHIQLEIRMKNNEGHWKEFGCNIYEPSTTHSKTLMLILNNIELRKWVEVKYKNLFDNSPNAILFIDFKGVIIDANQSTQKVFGYKEDFFIGKSLEDFDDLFPIELKNFYKKTFQAYFKKEFPKPIEIKIKTELNDCVWLEVQASVIKQDNNIYIQLLFQNITEKKKRELLEQKFKEDLEKEVEARTGDLNFAFQQQKKYVDQILKSSQFKTEFMSTMSHELRTPLNAIIGFTELLLEEVYGPLNTEQREFVNDIKISAEDQFEMIKNILNISKIESGQITMKIQSFSLNSMIEQIFSSLKPLIGNKKLQFRVVGLENEKMLEADPIRFKEILLNLLSNAVKFTIEGIITLKIKELNDKWEFEVSDMGIGIDTKDFPIIFKDFKRVDSTYVRSVPGTGLGLSLTKRLIELHGGEITFYSVLGVGTTFCFSIIKKFSNLNT